MRRFLCLLKNRLERLAIYSLLKKFVLIGFLTVPLSFLLSSNVSASSITSVNNFTSTTNQADITNPNYWQVINHGTVTIPYQIDIIHITQNNQNPIYYLRNINGSVNLGGTLTGNYFNGDVTIGIFAYGNLINQNSCNGIDADLYPSGVQIREKNVQVLSCSVDIGTNVHALYVRVRVGGSFYGESSFSSFYFSINNSSNFLVSCNSRQSSQSTLCSSSDYWGLGSSIQSWTASADPNTAILESISSVLGAQQQQDQQDRDDISQSKDDADATAEDLSQDIDNASSSLLTIIGNFVNVIINPPQRDCVINGDMGHMNLGQIDLCQLSLPSSFQVISTLLMIGFIIPFAYSLISTFLSLLKGATQD